MILVTGATGTTGSDIIRELSNAGAKNVRVLVRNPSKARAITETGIDLVEGDFDQPATLGPALEGVERALLLTPPTPQTFEQQKAFIDEAQRARVRYIVKFSAIGASTTAPGGFLKWHGQAEDALRASGLAYTMLQPNSFMQNLLGQARQIAAEGRIYQPVGDARVSFVDTRDVARATARVLMEDGHEGKSYVLTGPEALSYSDIAEKLSAATGKQIEYVPISKEDFRKGALAAGLPEWLVGALELLNEEFISGRSAIVNDNVRNTAGKEANSFDLFARDFAQAFRGEAV